MLEGINEIRRGTIDDALRAGRAEVVKWSAKDAGIKDISLCGLKGSPTIVKQVYAPKPREEKAEFVPAEGLSSAQLANSLIDALFAKKPGLEADLVRAQR